MQRFVVAVSALFVATSFSVTHCLKLTGMDMPNISVLVVYSYWPGFRFWAPAGAAASAARPAMSANAMEFVFIKVGESRLNKIAGSGAVIEMQ